jgi:hypothetical protein
MSVTTVLHAFLARETSEVREHLLEFLPDKIKEQVKRLPPFIQPMDPTLFENGDLLEQVHWSWFLPTLKSYPAEEQSLFLSALDPTSAQVLAEEIPCKWRSEQLTEIGRAYLRHLLLNSLVGPHDRLIPKPLLLPSPLNRLLSLTKQQLILLIDFLSMHDLAAEMRHIVETRTMKKLAGCLTHAERTFLKRIATKAEPFTVPRMRLEQWNGQCEELRYVLHRRGIARLGLALSRQDSGLIWYLCHQLDIGRGTSLLKHSVQESPQTTIEAAAQQVEELLKHE